MTRIARTKSEENKKENITDLSPNSKNSMITSIRRVTRNGLKHLENVVNSGLNLINKSSEKLKKEKSNDVPKKKYIPLSKCPHVNYLGEIKYYHTEEEISKECLILLDQFETNYKNIDKIPISFDMEWPFDFKTGPKKTSVIQIFLDESKCLIFSVGQMDKLPNDLVQVINHPKISFYGVNIKNDLRKLERDFPSQINSEVLVANCKDLGLFYNEIKNISHRWSLEKLVNKLCRLQMDKSMKIRMSKWNVIPLEEHQLKYAANDVYIGYMVYESLKKIKQEKEEKLLNKRKVIETAV